MGRGYALIDAIEYMDSWFAQAVAAIVRGEERVS
jgi:hypothetical protein